MKKIKELCNQTNHFNELIKVLKTISGIGDTIAVQLISLLPELGLLDRKQNCKSGRARTASQREW